MAPMARKTIDFRCSLISRGDMEQARFDEDQKLFELQRKMAELEAGSERNTRKSQSPRLNFEWFGLFNLEVGRNDVGWVSSKKLF